MIEIYDFMLFLGRVCACVCVFSLIFSGTYPFTLLNMTLVTVPVGVSSSTGVVQGSAIPGNQTKMLIRRCYFCFVCNCFDFIVLSSL